MYRVQPVHMYVRVEYTNDRTKPELNVKHASARRDAHQEFNI